MRRRRCCRTSTTDRRIHRFVLGCTNWRARGSIQLWRGSRCSSAWDVALVAYTWSGSKGTLHADSLFTLVVESWARGKNELEMIVYETTPESRTISVECTRRALAHAPFVDRTRVIVWCTCVCER